jgi:hypothetical protein
MDATPSFRFTLTETFRAMARRPALWILGAVISALGWCDLPMALLSGITHSSANPVGGGVRGVLRLAAIAVIALIIEVAMARAINEVDEEIFVSLGYGATRAGAISGYMLLMVLLALIITLAVGVPLFGMFGTGISALLALIFPLAVNLSVIAFSFAAALALVLPALVLAPIGLRALRSRKVGPLGALLYSLNLAGERPGLATLCTLTCLTLDVLIWVIGSTLHARDLSATSLLGITTLWNGTSAAKGGAMLALGAMVATFEVALWTVFCRQVEVSLKVDPTEGATAASGAALARRSLVTAAVQSRHAIRTIMAAPGLLVVAAGIGFIGMPSPADLVSMYNLLPKSDRVNTIQNLYFAAPFMQGPKKILLVLGAFVVSMMLSAILIAATGQATRGQVIDWRGAIRSGTGRMISILFALAVSLATIGLIGCIVIVGFLFAIAFIVSFLPGLDPLAESFNQGIVTLGILSWIILVPFVARAVILEGKKGTDAASRAFDVAISRPMATLLLFLVTIALDLLKGPLASFVGLITNGWGVLMALIYNRHLEQPLAGRTVMASGALYIAAIAIIAFKAALWTDYYRNVASEVPMETGRQPFTKRRRQKPSKTKTRPSDEPLNSPAR